MKKYDSFGAQQLPDDPLNFIAFDWQDNPLFEGEVCFVTEAGYVREEDMMDYVKQNFSKVEIGGI